MRQPNGDVIGPVHRVDEAPRALAAARRPGDDAGERLALGEDLVLLALELGQVLVDALERPRLLLAHGEGGRLARRLGGAQGGELVALLLQHPGGVGHGALPPGDGVLLRVHLVARGLEAADQLVVAAEEVVDHVHAADEVLEVRGGEEDVHVVQVVALVAEDGALREVALLELELGLRRLELELLEAQLLAQHVELLAGDGELLLDGGDLVAEAVELASGWPPACRRGR